MKSPCGKECGDRSVTCHSTCEAYLTYKAERDAIRQQRNKERIAFEYFKEKDDKKMKFVHKQQRRGNGKN